MKIAIIGAGDFGTALGGILAAKGLDIDYYDTRIEKERLSDVVNKAKFIVLAVPSKSISYVLPHLPKNIPLIVATKGILTSSVFGGFDDWMVLSGPGYAKDIKAMRSTHLTATDPRIVDLFATDYLDFDLTSDKQGVLMCGSLKNVYAIYAGYLNLKPDSSEHEQYLKRAALEMQSILSANAADPETVHLSCGVGDLRITCYLPSRNYEFGQILRRNSLAKPEKTVEGISALKRIIRGEIKYPKDLPLLKAIIEKAKAWN